MRATIWLDESVDGCRFDFAVGATMRKTNTVTEEEQLELLLHWVQGLIEGSKRRKQDGKDYTFKMSDV